MKIIRITHKSGSVFNIPFTSEIAPSDIRDKLCKADDADACGAIQIGSVFMTHHYARECAFELLNEDDD